MVKYDFLILRGSKNLSFFRCLKIAESSNLFLPSNKELDEFLLARKIEQNLNFFVWSRSIIAYPAMNLSFEKSFKRIGKYFAMNLDFPLDLKILLPIPKEYWSLKNSAVVFENYKIEWWRNYISIYPLDENPIVIKNFPIVSGRYKVEKTAFIPYGEKLFSRHEGRYLFRDDEGYIGPIYRNLSNEFEIRASTLFDNNDFIAIFFKKDEISLIQKISNYLNHLYLKLNQFLKIK